jgi:hypothetical protein
LERFAQGTGRNASFGLESLLLEGHGPGGAGYLRVFVEFPQFTPSSLMGKSDLRVDGGGVPFVGLRALMIRPVAGFRLVGQQQARERAKCFKSALRLHVVTSVEVLPPLLEDVLHQLADRAQGALGHRGISTWAPLNVGPGDL